MRQRLQVIFLPLNTLLPLFDHLAGVKAAYMKQLLGDSLPPQWVPQIGACSGTT